MNEMSYLDMVISGVENVWNPRNYIYFRKTV
jgi:hypothetical protein